jgi:hypothetical protein
MKKAFWAILFVIVVIAIAIISFLAFMPENKCNYNDPSKSYVRKETPCIINFMCIKDRVAFSDECGCGCKLAGPASP